MAKEKKILFYFISFILGLLTTMFIGVLDVFADEMEKVGFLTDKTNIQVIVPYNNAPLVINQYGEYMLTDVDELLIFVDNYNFTRDNIYQLELYMPNATLTNANTFTVYGSNSINDNVSCRAIKILQDNKQYVNFRWSCSENVNSLTFNIKNSNNESIVKSGIFRWDYTFLWNVLSTTDNSDIINGLDKVEQSIIESNKETQEVIKEQFNTCRNSYNIFDFKGLLDQRNISYIENDDGSITFDLINNSDVLSLYNNPFSFSKDTIISGSWSINAPNTSFILEIYSNNSWSSVLSTRVSNFTNVSTSKIRFNWTNNDYGKSVTINNFIINNGATLKPYEPFGVDVCQNKIDETNDKLDNLTGAITDDSSPNIDGLQDSAGWLPPGPLDSVLNLPLSLFNSLTTNLNKSCSPISIPLPYVNKNLTIPCINTLYEKIGVSTFINWLGVIVSGLMLYTYLLKLYKWIEDRISLNETHSVDNWGGL